MKLSVWSSYYIDLEPENSIRDLKTHGYNYCEFSDGYDFEIMKRRQPVAMGSKFCRFARELGIELLQGHLNLAPFEDHVQFIKTAANVIKLFYVSNFETSTANFKENLVS